MLFRSCGVLRLALTVILQPSLSFFASLHLRRVGRHIRHLPARLEGTEAGTEAATVDHLFVFGAGFTGRRLCQLAREDLGSDVRISASCRQRSIADALVAEDLCNDSFTFDLDSTYRGLCERGWAALESATHLVVTVPPIADFDKDPLLALHRGF